MPTCILRRISSSEEKSRIHLDGTGAIHHVDALRADPGHVGGHDVVAGLGHSRRFGARPFRAGAETEEADAERLGHLAQLGKMGVRFATGLVDGLQRCAGKLELAARFERYRALAGGLDEADDPPGVDDRLPAEHRLHAPEQRGDAALAFVGHRRIVAEEERELLMFRPDPEGVLGLAAGSDVARQIGHGRDRRPVCRVTGHGASLRAGRGRGLAAPLVGSAAGALRETPVRASEKL